MEHQIFAKNILGSFIFGNIMERYFLGFSTNHILFESKIWINHEMQFQASNLHIFDTFVYKIHTKLIHFHFGRSFHGLTKSICKKARDMKA